MRERRTKTRPYCFIVSGNNVLSLPAPEPFSQKVLETNAWPSSLSRGERAIFSVNFSKIETWLRLYGRIH